MHRRTSRRSTRPIARAAASDGAAQSPGERLALRAAWCRQPVPARPQAMRNILRVGPKASAVAATGGAERAPLRSREAIATGLLRHEIM